MKSLVLIILFLAFTSEVSAQKKTPEHYSYPLENSYKPLSIHVNIILLYRKDGSGNFDLNNKEQNSLFIDYIEEANRRLSNLVRPDNLKACYSGTDFFQDTKIRFKYNIIKIKNEYAWNYINGGSDPENRNFNGFIPSEKWYLKNLDDSIRSSGNIPLGINAYFTSNGDRFDEVVDTKAKTYDVASFDAGQSPTETNLKRSSQVHIPNRYLKYILHKYRAPIDYNTKWEETRKWHVNEGSGIFHEIGHNFGLHHSNEYHQSNKCKYSIMSQKDTDPRNYLQPTEIKKMHWNLTRTNLMQFVTEDSHYGVTWQIEKDTIWDKPRRFYNDFEIVKDVTLTISDSIILPPQSFIKLNKNSKIIFKGKGKIVNAFGKDYKNFEKHKTAFIFKE